MSSQQPPVPQGAGHFIINPFGRLALVSRSALRTLDRSGYLRRHESGLLMMDRVRYAVYKEAEAGTRLFRELGGESCAGLSSCNCGCDECKERLGIKTQECDEYYDVDRVVRDVRMKRKR